jgi:hypothetical protein
MCEWETELGDLMRLQEVLFGDVSDEEREERRMERWGIRLPDMCVVGQPH